MVRRKMARIEPGPLWVNANEYVRKDWFNLSLQQQLVVVEESGYVGEVQDRDTVKQQYSSGIRRRDSLILIETNSESQPSFLSESPSVALVDQQGYVTTINAGTVSITVYVGAHQKSIQHRGAFLGPALTSVFDRYDTGTLGEEITNQISSLIAAGKTSMNLVSNGQWNSDCWASGLDWSGVALSNSTANNRRGATLISPQHVYMATHFPVGVGATVIYLTSAGEQITRTLSARQDVGNDIMIGLLDSPVADATYYKVLPSNYREYISLIQQPQIICTDQQRKAILRNWLDSDQNVVHLTASQLSENIITGDSGQPIFTVIQDELVLLGSHWTATSGRNASSMIPQINSAMTSLGGGYQLSVVDLSAYTNYGPQ